jgi:hypothetical protein
VKPSKTCAACGREITWRKKWERDWDQVRWCSEKCRSAKVSEQDQQLEAAVLALLDRRPSDATICPSEVARQLGGEQWRDLMEPTRAAARRLVAAGDVVITQGGHAVDPSTARGPIRIRRA